MCATHVFAGPTISRREVLEIVPSARVHPPARHGSFLMLDPRPTDTIILVDGVFHGTAPIRHKEILRILDRGTRVLGASSMGALRAAELEPWGMEGIGTVFRWLRAGLITGDDEVALFHSDAEENHRPLSVPLVNVRAGLARLRLRRILSAADEQRILAAGRGLHFGSRTITSIVAAARDCGLPTQTADLVTTALRTGMPDLKARDARLALRCAESGRPSRPALAIRPRPTSFVFEWEQQARRVPGWDGLRAGDVLRFSQVMASDFPDFRRKVIVAALCGDDVAAAMTDGGSQRRREEILLRRLWVGEGPFSHRSIRSWAASSRLGELSNRAAVSRVVSLARWAPGIAPLDVLIDGLLSTDGLHRACRSTAEACRFRVRLERDTGFETGRMTSTTIGPVLVELWGEDTAEERDRRGFFSAEELTAWADLFGPHVLVHRTRPFRLLAD